MAEILSKTAYAAHANVTTGAVSNWIRRRKLTAPALRADGSIDAELADRQLGVTVQPVNAASARARAPAAVSAGPGAPNWTQDDTASRQLLRARALSASVDAERKRRELNEERGKYTLAADADAALARTLAGFLTDVEQSFLDLSGKLRLTREQLIGLRQWWRDHRVRAAAAARLAAAGERSFIEDNAA